MTLPLLPEDEMNLEDHHPNIVALSPNEYLDRLISVANSLLQTGAYTDDDGLIGENHVCDECVAAGHGPVFVPDVLPAATDLLESFIAEANRRAEDH